MLVVLADVALRFTFVVVPFAVAFLAASRALYSSGRHTTTYLVWAGSAAVVGAAAIPQALYIGAPSLAVQTAALLVPLGWVALNRNLRRSDAVGRANEAVQSLSRVKPTLPR